MKCANVYKSADCETLYFTKKGSIYSGQYYTTSVHINKWVDCLWYKIANPHGVRKKVQVQRKWPLLSSVSLALILGVPLLECVTVQQALITNLGLYVILLQNAKNTPCFAFAWFCMVLSRAKRVCMCQYAWSLRHDDTQYTGIGDCICCDCGWMRTITQPFHPDCENNCLVAWFASKRGLFNHTRSVMMVLVSAPPYMCSLPTKLYSAGFCCWGRQSAARYICTSCLAHIETSCLPVSLSHTPGLRLWSWRAICHAKSHTHAHKDGTRIQRAFVWRCETVSCLVQTCTSNCNCLIMPVVVLRLVVVMSGCEWEMRSVPLPVFSFTVATCWIVMYISGPYSCILNIKRAKLESVCSFVLQNSWQM